MYSHSIFYPETELCRETALYQMPVTIFRHDIDRGSVDPLWCPLSRSIRRSVRECVLAPLGFRGMMGVTVEVSYDAVLIGPLVDPDSYVLPSVARNFLDDFDYSRCQDPTFAVKPVSFVLPVSRLSIVRNIVGGSVPRKSLQLPIVRIGKVNIGEVSIETVNIQSVDLRPAAKPLRSRPSQRPLKEGSQSYVR